MNAKKLGAVLATLGILATFLVATNTASAASFSDVPTNYEYSEAVGYLQDAGAVQGYSDGTYKPANTIIRAEFVKIILEAAGIEPGGSNCFPDVTDQWFAPYVCKAKDEGLVQGYPDGTFKPERPINFIESGKVVTEGLGLDQNDAYQDAWFHKYVKSVEGEEAIPPSVETFDQYLSRGEMAEMVWRVETDQTEESGDYDALKESTENQQITNVESCQALVDKFAEFDNYYYYGIEEEMALDMAVPTTAVMTEKAAEPTSGEVRTGGGGGIQEFSTTNVQVEGVDEADFVKTDGEFIYIIKDNKIRVVRAYHPNEMEELSALEFEDANFWPTNMYVDGDRLVVIGNSYYSYPYPMRDEPMLEIASHPYYGGGRTVVYIFDISDKTNIQEFRKMTFEGDYSQSRKVGEMVYVVLNRYAFMPYADVEDPIEILPQYLDTNDEVAQPLVDCTDIKHIPIIEDPNYLIVVGIPVDDADAEIVHEVVLGRSDNIYASTENLYVASANWYWRSDNENTNLYKFSLGRDGIEYQSKGKAPGHILNQFSMDEYDDHFRIATTRGFSWDGTSDNNVYVLDSDMNMVGKLEGLAPGETIYSTRFIGKRLYMVTFKKIDPFFVIDMGNHSFPEVLGKLKIPGFSDYLHPYDENHVLGFGKETVDPDELEAAGRTIDFAWFQGMKMGLFDVTDVENPVEKFKVVIGDRGTESPLLYDHKALLFDRGKNIIAFPVKIAELPEEVKDPDMPSNTYGDFVFQGAHVYGLDLVNGFDLKAEISHYSETEVADKAGYYWYGPKDIERVLYIGDFLYTVSKGMVKANDMTSGYSEANSVEVGPPEEEYYDFIY
ncbi:beta-propeller domain-containing protein [Patescibacteria group bacterium]